MSPTDEELDEILELLTTTVRHLVDAPTAVELNLVKGKHSMLVEVMCVEEDRRHVIGRSGRTAQALRTLFGAMFARKGMSFDLKIIED